eukprot:403363465
MEAVQHTVDSKTLNLNQNTYIPSEVLYENDKFYMRYAHSLQEIEEIEDYLAQSQCFDPVCKFFGIGAEDLQHIMFTNIREMSFQKNYRVFVIEKETQRKCSSFVIMDYNDQISPPQDSPTNYQLFFKQMAYPQQEALKVCPEFFQPEIFQGRVRLISVFPEFRGKGILQFVFEGFEAIAKARNYEYLHMVMTTPESQHYGNKRQGYKILGKTYYGEQDEIKEAFKPHEESMARWRDGDRPFVQYGIYQVSEQKRLEKQDNN